MRHRGQQVLDVVRVVLGLHAAHPDAAAVLGVVAILGDALDVAAGGHGHHPDGLGNEILDAQFTVADLDLGPPLVAVRLAHVEQFLADHRNALVPARQQLPQVGNQLLQLVELGLQFVDGQSRKLMESHLQDGRGLFLRQ